MKRSVRAAAMLAVAALLATPALAQNPSLRTVEVTGHGEAKAKPDTVVVSFFVQNQNDTADAATAQHSETVRKLIDALKAKIGPSAKITTADYALMPNTIYSQSVGAPMATPGSTPWALTMGVQIESDSLDDLGRALDAAIAAGASKRIQMSGFEEVPVTTRSQEGAGDASAVRSKLGMPMRYEIGPGTPMKRVAMAQVEIDTEGLSVSECLHKANEVFGRIEKETNAILKDNGSISPSTLNIVQKQEQQPRYSPPPQQTQRQVYEAHSSVIAETTEIDKLGTTVQTGMNAGATRLNNITFTLSNDNQARKEAIDKASADARNKAQEVAKSMGVKLGNILKISTNAAPRPQVIYGGAYQGSFSTAVTAHRAELPVMPREVGFSADVSVAYAIE